MKKRLLSLLIAGVMTAGLLSGCGASEDTQDQSDSTAQSDQSADETSSDTEANTEDTSDGGASDGKTLVVPSPLKSASVWALPTMTFCPSPSRMTAP